MRARPRATGWMPVRVLFLDDDPERQTRFRMNAIGCDLVQVWNYEEAAVALAGDRFDQVFLDHDLSERQAVWPALDGGDEPYGHGERTGLDVAQLVAALPDEKRPSLVIIHSYNPDGARRMHQVLADAGMRRVYREPFNAARTCPQAEGRWR